MKQILLTTLIVLTITSLFAQVTLQKTYDYSAAVVKLETLGYKYYIMDVPNSQCRIYNMDHSIFKTINCAVPGGYYLSDIKYISENLFNTDSKIELAYTYYQYVATTSSYYYNYGSKVVNESGTNLITIDGAQYIYAIQTGNTSYQFFAYCFDYAVYPEKVWTNIYSLPGTLVTATNIFGGQSAVSMNAYPNPATDIIKLDYDLPANVKSASLNVVNSNGRTVKNFMIDRHSDHLALSIGELSAGVYYYYIEYDNMHTLSKKMVVKK
jgi:hypothetical protein